MKKRTLKLAVFSLMMTAMLFNCKDKDNADPTKPDDNITKELDNLNIATPTLDKPAEVKSETSSVEASAKATEVNGALAGIAASGTVPESVTAGAADVKAVLSDAEISTLNNVSAETINAVANGGALSPELQAIYDKALSNPALAAYFPKFNFPTVNGVAVRAQRASTTPGKSSRISGTQATEATEQIEKVLIDDACLAAAEATFQTAKTRLDGQRATAVAAVTAQYQADIAPIATEQTGCTSTATTAAAGYRTEIRQTVASANAALDAAQGILGPLYSVYKALLVVQEVGALSSINELEASDKQACIAISTAKTANAAAAQTANIAKVDALYAPAIAEATRLRSAALASCHNQGGGN